MTGQCYCGAVEFTVEHPQGCDYCHCSICRRLHSAPFVPWASFKQDDLHITAGEGKLKMYQSSEHATRTSCAECGTWLFFESAGWPRMVDVALAALPADSGLVPTAHVYWADRDPRFAPNDDLPKYPQDSEAEVA